MDRETVFELIETLNTRELEVADSMLARFGPEAVITFAWLSQLEVVWYA